jgi:3-hydroxymyristoyl/3-hydroxydecanoyl-(acyl carrier protein) dehydratase
MTERTVNIEAPLAHPCYEGHFPGRPILPGVVLLELVIACVDRGAPRAIPNVKFQRALRPGETCSLRWKDSGDRVSFQCAMGPEPVAEGVLVYAESARG